MSTTMTSGAAYLAELGQKEMRATGRIYKRLHGRVVPYGEWTRRGAFYERISRGAFTASILDQPEIPLLLFHDHESFPVGLSRPDGWRDEPDGLYAVFDVAPTPSGQFAAQEADAGRLRGLSVGYSPERSSWEHPVRWDPDVGDLDQVTRIEARLAEVSLTPVPAFARAMVAQVDYDLFTGT